MLWAMSSKRRAGPLAACNRPNNPRTPLWLYAKGGVCRNDIVLRTFNPRGQCFECVFSTLFVVIFGLHMTFDRIPYSSGGHDCHESHPLLLVLAQCLVERLPRIGDFL